MGGQQSVPVGNVPQWVRDQQMAANSNQLSGGSRGTVPPIIQAPQLQRPIFQPQQNRQVVNTASGVNAAGKVSAVRAGTGGVSTVSRVGTVSAQPSTPSAVVAAAPAQISYNPPRPIKQGSAPVTMSQLTGPQKFLGGYFVGGPDDSGICPISIMFLLILVMIISIAVIISSYRCNEDLRNTPPTIPTK